MRKISEVKHYKISADGTLRFVGIERVEVEETRENRYEFLAARDRADMARHRHDCDNLEALADAACEAQ